MKLTKIFRDNRYAGSVLIDGKKYSKFQYIKMTIVRRIKIALGLSATALVGSWIVMIAVLLSKDSIKPTMVFAEDNSIEIFKAKIDTLKYNVVEQLMSCEGGGYKENDGIIIFDSNNKASIGLAQFQIATVQHYYKVLYGKTVNKKEAVMIALDKNQAMNLAKDIMFTTKNKAGKDWVNCNNKLGLDAQIDVIKKMEL